MWNVVLVTLVTALIPVIVEVAQKYIREDVQEETPQNDVEEPTEDSSTTKPLRKPP